MSTLPKVVILDGPAAPDLPDLTAASRSARLVRVEADQFAVEVPDADAVFVWDSSRRRFVSRGSRRPVSRRST